MASRLTHTPSSAIAPKAVATNGLLTMENRKITNASSVVTESQRVLRPLSESAPRAASTNGYREISWIKRSEAGSSNTRFLIMTEYEKHLTQRGLNEYILDGAVNPAKWVESKVRIMFWLKETYGYQNCGIINIQDCAHSWLDTKKIKTYQRAVSLAASVELGIAQKRILTEQEIVSLSTNRDLLHDSLDRMAVVDIKKHSGLSTSDDREIREESRQNAAILTVQIRSLQPTVIIAGGNVCWHSLVYDLGLFQEAENCPMFQAVICNNTVLCRSNHPAARGGFNIHKLHCSIVTAASTAPVRDS